MSIYVLGPPKAGEAGRISLTHVFPNLRAEVLNPCSPSNSPLPCIARHLFSSCFYRWFTLCWLPHFLFKWVIDIHDCFPLSSVLYFCGGSTPNPPETPLGYSLLRSSDPLTPPHGNMTPVHAATSAILDFPISSPLSLGNIRWQIMPGEIGLSRTVKTQTQNCQDVPCLFEALHKKESFQASCFSMCGKLRII